MNPGRNSNVWVGNNFETDTVEWSSDGGPGTGCIQQVTDSTFSQRLVGLWIEAGQGQYDITLDNFFVTGTKP